MGSSAKKSVVCARFGAVGFAGAIDGMPDICDWVEWLDEGGDMLVVVMLEGGSVGLGSPALEVILLLRGGGGGVGCAAGTVARGAGRFRVVTISSGRSYGDAYPPFDLSAKLCPELAIAGRGDWCCDTGCPKPLYIVPVEVAGVCWAAGARFVNWTPAGA